MSVLARVLRRFGYAPIKRHGGFAGAFGGRTLSDWVTSAAGPNQELFASIAKLRDRARDLEKNNPLVRRYLHLVAENVVGPDGITLQVTAENAPNPSAKIEAAYWDWGRPATYSVDGRLGRAQFEQAVIRGIARDGEAFVRTVRTGDYGLSLQLLDPALVDEGFNRAPGDGLAAVKLGIELDRWDRPLAYHVLSAHRHDTVGTPKAERVRIPADEILHLFVQRRPGQVRGESWLAPVMVPLRMLDGYAEAELFCARTAAQKMGFIVTKDAESAPVTDADDTARRTWEGSPGAIEELPVGQEFQQWDPTHPSQNFALFVTQVTKYVAAGLNVSFAALTSDLREVNYASSRIGLLQERDAWRALQAWFADAFCEPVFREWRTAAFLKGKLPVRMTPERYTHRWQARGWEYTNPREEMVADALAIATGLRSPQQIIAAKGGDAEEILDDIAAWQQMAAARGVTLFVPNSVVDPDAQDPEGSAASHGDDRPDGGTGRGGRPDSRVALVRRAG